MPNPLDKLFTISQLLTKRFGASSPFEIVTRLTEEVGELAKEVNHLEGSGVKTSKLGPASTEALAREAQDVIRCVLQLVEHYGARAEFEKSIDSAHEHFVEKYKESER